MDRIELFNKFFNEQTGVNLITKFTLVSLTCTGEIEVTIEDISLNFKVEIPDYFPFSYKGFCVRFTNPDLIGYPHFGSYLCVHTSSTSDPSEKLQFELNGLRSWIKDYYIDKKTDGNYEYLQIPYQKLPNAIKVQSFLFQDSKNEFKKNSFGLFQYTHLGNEIYFINQFDCNPQIINLNWSNHINNQLPKNRGLWVFVENEPIVRKKIIACKWNEIERYFDYQSKQFLVRLHETQLEKNEKNRKQFFPLLIGYKISDKNITTIHWEAAIIDLKDFFIKNDFDRKSRITNYSFLNKKILWQKTINCSYHRFFGRGKFADEFSTKNILIIGIGAIGSSLAKLLIKGGVIELTITDIDSVEQGNLCRAEYALYDIGINKTSSLQMQLSMISPYVNINVINVNKYPVNSDNFKSVKTILKKYDLIFDCSTDNEMALMLDKMEFNNKVINFSITNKAKEFLCITGSDIAEMKYHIVKQLDYKPALFYEGIGCHYPTFEASYLDINTHLFYAMKQIIHSIGNKLTLKSFVIKNDGYDEQLSSKFLIKSFLQKELNLSIFVNDELLSKIKSLSIRSYPNESGGILIGSFFNNNKTIYISEIYTPSKSEKSKTSFKRFVKDINEYLLKKHKESNGELIYLGEWHSHPDSSSKYSTIDFNSMVNIAVDNKVKTKNPILLINGFSTKNNHLTFYVYKNKKLYEYEEN
ncbi:MAG: ThiF family adenylyltransferase [Candidatus Nanoarchaeia archaeon]|nr:ThiF family adenylyltransferase [Candidatus Nanoarchaeia archaeon]